MNAITWIPRAPWPRSKRYSKNCKRNKDANPRGGFTYSEVQMAHANGFARTPDKILLQTHRSMLERQDMELARHALGMLDA
eukprot:7343539-Lingulodinium_polyedra.AAC.1